jgi:hypothetical protein
LLPSRERARGRKITKNSILAIAVACPVPISNKSQQSIKKKTKLENVRSPLHHVRKFRFTRQLQVQSTRFKTNKKVLGGRKNRTSRKNEFGLLKPNLKQM